MLDYDVFCVCVDPSCLGHCWCRSNAVVDVQLTVDRSLFLIVTSCCFCTRYRLLYPYLVDFVWYGSVYGYRHDEPWLSLCVCVCVCFIPFSVLCCQVCVPHSAGCPGRGIRSGHGIWCSDGLPAGQQLYRRHTKGVTRGVTGGRNWYRRSWLRCCSYAARKGRGRCMEFVAFLHRWVSLPCIDVYCVNKTSVIVHASESCVRLNTFRLAAVGTRE